MRRIPYNRTIKFFSDSEKEHHKQRAYLLIVCIINKFQVTRCNPHQPIVIFSTCFVITIILLEKYKKMAGANSCHLLTNNYEKENKTLL